MYIPHDYWMICDRCGSRYRRSKMREHWTGLWLCVRYCWDVQHPQTFTESVIEDSSVPVAYPDVKQVVGETTVYVDLDAYGTKIYLVSVTGLSNKDPIGIVMDNGACFWSFIDGIPETDDPLKDSDGELIYDSDGEVIFAADSGAEGYIILNLAAGIHSGASEGNTVYLPSINNESWA